MAKSATKNESVATAADRPPTSLAQPATATTSDVALHAFDRYLARGCENGHDVEDWLQAERELNGSTNLATA